MLIGIIYVNILRKWTLVLSCNVKRTKINKCTQKRRARIRIEWMKPCLSIDGELPVVIFAIARQFRLNGEVI